MTKTVDKSFGGKDLELFAEILPGWIYLLAI